ncbi:flagellar basal body P-ring formation chaperone FlgA [Halobacteriovorax sp. GB3]|uniref:flagellar basal body P-ring formation chaperone FlgA n=1 Tax=Halobacteriovorax sp. GB3 TaxID=2719615 RepID=UPI002361F3EF|nr:flagellar basal body P-ring formation chaperone FlgA [Halobacteriovorax sp. GB3]MDD0854824.1 flagellar basal body P-ring formation chaperone FlgA [Halobacteriovorax sp. GB3]
MTKVFFFFITLLSLKSFSCEVNTADKLFFVKDTQVTNEQALNFKGCSSEQKDEVLSIIKTLEGTIHTSHLKKMGNFSDVTFTKTRIQITTLNQYLREKLSLESDLFITNINTNGMPLPLGLNQDETLQLKCFNCKEPGNYAMNLEIQSPFNKRTKWGQLKIQRKIQVLKLKDEIRVANETLSPSLFEKAFIFADFPSKYIKDAKELVFYKANRSLSKGHVLLRTDIVPQNIVQRGQDTQVIIKTKHLTLTGAASALRSGSIGQMVELRNKKSKRTFSAKVVDFNKVMVEL